MNNALTPGFDIEIGGGQPIHVCGINTNDVWEMESSASVYNKTIDVYICVCLCVYMCLCV